MISASKCRPLNSADRFRLMYAKAYQTARIAFATHPLEGSGFEDETPDEEFG